MAYETETDRRKRLAEINIKQTSRETLTTKYGQVWNTAELTAEFEVMGFMAPYVIVQCKADGRKGSLEFQHFPRLYFSFVSDDA